MFEALESILPPVLGLAAILYWALAVLVSRSAPKSVIAFFLFLIGVMIAGQAFNYGTTDPNIYGIGRVLVFFASSFMPVAFFSIYRTYTDGPPSVRTIIVLSIIPVVTTILTLTNSMHNLIWATVVTETGIRFTEVSESIWFSRVHAPYSYGLFGYSVIALASRLSSLAPAHRNMVLMLVISAVLPFVASILNIFFGIGPIEFPFLSSTLTLLLPVYAYASLSLRVYDFSPLAYQTLFNHVRDPIIVLDNDQRIICANLRAAEMLDTPVIIEHDYRISHMIEHIFRNRPDRIPILVVHSYLALACVCVRKFVASGLRLQPTRISDSVQSCARSDNRAR